MPDIPNPDHQSDESEVVSVPEEIVDGETVTFAKAFPYSPNNGITVVTYQKGEAVVPGEVAALAREGGFLVDDKADDKASPKNQSKPVAPKTKS